MAEQNATAELTPTRLSLVAAQVCETIAEVLAVDPQWVMLTAALRDDLGADSLDLVNLIVALSQRFEADICDEEIGAIRTVGELVAYLEKCRCRDRRHLRGVRGRSCHAR